MRTLIDAGADVHGFGDVHGGDVIGWAAGVPDAARRKEVLDLLVAHGARHHIFSAIAVGDADLVQSVVEENPGALARRRSRFEQGQTPLHFALASPDGLATKKPRYDLAELLIELGADVEATDDRGRTPLAVAMLHGDVEAMRILKAAGAKEPAPPSAGASSVSPSLAGSFVKQATPMLCVTDPDATASWYQSLGFTLVERWPEAGQGPISWAMLRFGKIEVMIQGKVARPHDQIALWFYTNRIEELYRAFKARQLDAARAELAGQSNAATGIRFMEDLYEPIYGGKQFSIADESGFELVFHGS